MTQFGPAPCHVCNGTGREQSLTDQERASRDQAGLRILFAMFSIPLVVVVTIGGAGVGMLLGGYLASLIPGLSVKVKLTAEVTGLVIAGWLTARTCLRSSKLRAGVLDGIKLTLVFGGIGLVALAFALLTW